MHHGCFVLFVAFDPTPLTVFSVLPAVGAQHCSLRGLLALISVMPSVHLQEECPSAGRVSICRKCVLRLTQRRSWGRCRAPIKDRSTHRALDVFKPEGFLWHFKNPPHWGHASSTPGLCLFHTSSVPLHTGAMPPHTGAVPPPHWGCAHQACVCIWQQHLYGGQRTGVSRHQCRGEGGGGRAVTAGVRVTIRSYPKGTMTQNQPC